MPFIEDPNADARSLMNRAPCPCSGAVNGVQCRHYWALSQKFRAANSDTVRLGEKQRSCTKVPGWPLEFKSEEMPTSCQYYEPRKEPGLVALVQRACALALGLAPKAERLPRVLKGIDTEPKAVTWGYRAYDGEFEKFDPMTIEEIRKNREANPDRPVAFSHGMNPGSLTVEDIMTGPQVGMLKPGETIPGSDTKSQPLSKAVDDTLNEIFGNSEEKP